MLIGKLNPFLNFMTSFDMSREGIDVFPFLVNKNEEGSSLSSSVDEDEERDGEEEVDNLSFSF